MKEILTTNGIFVKVDDELDAALAYDSKARELYGEFANCNIPIIQGHI